jgi:transcriptional regulator with XRE-family HTH domain
MLRLVNQPHHNEEVVVPTIHDRIKRCREKGGLSRVQLAEKCGVTQQAVYGWEELSAMPSFHRLKTIAEVLKTTTEYLSAGIDVNVPLAEKYTLVRLLGTDKEGGIAVQHHHEVGSLADDHNSFAYRRDFLRTLGVAPEYCRVYINQDDSMTLGSQLLIDLKQTELQDDKVFLLDTPAGLKVRRLFIQIDGMVRVCADRANVPEQLVPASAVKLIGRVVAQQGAL